jgi:hypothetical protein
MGILSTVFSAEVMAILRCTEILLTKSLMRRRIHICSNTREASLVITTTASSWFGNVCKCWEKLSKFNSLSEYIPGPQGIPGN